MISTTSAIWRRQQIVTQFTRGIAIAFLAIAAVFIAPTPLRAQVSGAIFTTTAGCPGVDQNIYDSKDAVYLNGGPPHPNAAGLPPGDYCVQVTEPNGTVLGKSLTPVVTVGSDGNFVTCYQLSAIVNSATSGFTTAGYDDTTNPGGEYKVWVSQDCSFPDSASKTDNFKVKNNGGGPGSTATICVTKFYDANFNGVQDPGEPNLVGWEYCVVGNNNFSAQRFTFNPARCLVVDPDDYCVTEGTPVETNWVHTTDTSACFNLAGDGTQPVSFGNVCLGPGGGLTLGFWSNKNGQKLETAADFAFLSNSLCLVAGVNGGHQTFSTTLATAKTQLNTWLLNANATNMAYMLSAQLTAMELNVRHGFVSGTASVYEACLKDNGVPTGFITINDLMAAANASLCAHPVTKTAGTDRSYQECLKNALDDANNNKNFVESSPCPFSFDPSDSCPFTNP
jgi:hypothetical protein